MGYSENNKQRMSEGSGRIFFYTCTVHSQYEIFFIKTQLMHSL